jgi:hypothetical protein
MNEEPPISETSDKLTYDINQVLETFTPEPNLTDLMQLPKVEKKMIREARKQALEREVRRKQMNHDPKRQKERDNRMKERNSINAQRQRTFKQNLDKKRAAEERRANKNQAAETPIKPEFENDTCPTSTTETSTTPSQASAAVSEALPTDSASLITEPVNSETNP